jgi:flagellar biosynthesis chaperone FliJ
MTLRNHSELEVTERKLRLLEDEYASTTQQLGDNPYARELTLQSLKRMINQLKEEIARYQAGVGVADKS